MPPCASRAALPPPWPGWSPKASRWPVQATSPRGSCPAPTARASWPSMARWACRCAASSPCAWTGRGTQWLCCTAMGCKAAGWPSRWRRWSHATPRCWRPGWCAAICVAATTPRSWCCKGAPMPDDLDLAARLAAAEQQVAQLSEELEETNRGVLALYAELDTQAEELRHANELKSRFLAYMSHEFRTPLGVIQSMTRLLLERLGGPPTGAQGRQGQVL